MRNWIVYLFFFITLPSFAQDSLPGASLGDTLSPASKTNTSSRKWMATGVTVLGYGGSFILLNEAWYKNYPRSSFHVFDDSGEWLQMDKIGHAWTAYHTSRATTEMWTWAGMKKNEAIALGTGTSLLYMLSIEYLDGRSAEWGWSWADAGADLFGAALFAGQELGWKEQKIQIKFSSHRNSYSPAPLETRANQLFGKSLPERLLKDYNAQTYWLSANIRSIFPSLRVPEWLNIAVGYGAENMYGGYENLAYDDNGALIFDRRDLKRYRQWYLAPDVDLTRIKTKSRFLKTAFSILNVLKFPSPALELSNGKLRVKAIAF